MTEDDIEDDLVGNMVPDLDEWYGSKVWIAGRMVSGRFGPLFTTMDVRRYGVIWEKGNFMEGHIEILEFTGRGGSGHVHER